MLAPKFLLKDSLKVSSSHPNLLVSLRGLFSSILASVLAPGRLPLPHLLLLGLQLLYPLIEALLLLLVSLAALGRLTTGLQQQVVGGGAR